MQKFLFRLKADFFFEQIANLWFAVCLKRENFFYENQWGRMQCPLGPVVYNANR